MVVNLNDPIIKKIYIYAYSVVACSNYRGTGDFFHAANETLYNFHKDFKEFFFFFFLFFKKKKKKKKKK